MGLNRETVKKLLRISEEHRAHYFFLRFITSQRKEWECPPLFRVSASCHIFYFALTALLAECPFPADAASVLEAARELFPSLTVQRVSGMLDEFERAGLLVRLADRGERLGWWMLLSDSGAVVEPPRFEDMPGPLRKAFAACLERARPN